MSLSQTVKQMVVVSQRRACALALVQDDEREDKADAERGQNPRWFKMSHYAVFRPESLQVATRKRHLLRRPIESPLASVLVIQH
jgi:hypothetical protein